MMLARPVAIVGLLGGAVLWAACGARSSLEIGDPLASGGGGTGGVSPCNEGDKIPCGSDVGICKLGQEICHDGVWGPCQGGVTPRAEECNGLDDDCDGAIDEDFGLGLPCDGPDSDLCLDDIMTCDGCSTGPDNVEICNGVDDNCNGIVDADCEVGDCKPTLLVTGSVPSSPSCIDFPVTAGSEGVIEYPCAGGPVTATLGQIQFTGSVENGVVSLQGVAILVGPDNCWWKTSHFISGTLSSGVLSYLYTEQLIDSSPFCWMPCSETGDVTIQWIAPQP